MKYATVVLVLLNGLSAAAQCPSNITFGPTSQLFGQPEATPAAASELIVTSPTTTQFQGTINRTFSQQFVAAGGTPPYVWTAVSMPLGLQISSSGLVSGSPPRGGTTSSTIIVRDSVGRPACDNVTFTFQPFLTLQSSSNGSVIAPNTPFNLGTITSTVANERVTLTLVDSWIQFELGTDTTCRQTSNTMQVTAGTTATTFRACVSSAAPKPFATALISATGPGVPAVADGFQLRVSNSSSTFLAGFSGTDLTSGAIEQDVTLSQGSFSGSPSISYIPSGGNWLEETDNCRGAAACSVLIAGDTSVSALKTGDQVAARLDFLSGSSVVGSTIAQYTSFPSSLSVAAGTYSGSYDWPFNARATASGGTAPYTWSAAGLPTGLTISSDGLISGTPVQAGVTRAFLTATDSLGYTASRAVMFSFQQGAPALALVPAKRPPNPTLGDGTGVSISNNVGTLSSAPLGAQVTLTIAREDLQYFGFPSQNSSNADCTGNLSASTPITTTTPQAVYMCVHQIFIPLDKALRIYVHVTATAPGYAPVTVALPWESPAVYSMQVIPSSIDVSNGAGKVAVTVISNGGGFKPDVLQTISAQFPWITVASANPALPCVGRASCSFQVSPNTSQINTTTVGDTYSGLVTFKTDGGLSASLSVSYKYSGTQLAVGSNSFRVIAGKSFTATANVSGGTGPYSWSSSDMPGGVTLSASGTISGMLATTGVTQAHLTVRDGANHSVDGVVTFTAVLPQGNKTTDFDGDNKADFAVWRPSTGLWFVTPSQAAGPFIVQWGRSEDVPVSGDFDGDGKTDYAVWRPSNGTWYVTPSQATGPFIVQWGMSGDVPVSGDFDGDGRTDYTVWRPSDGTWYVTPSQAAGPFIEQWGMPGDVPVPGDFDGDGKSDYAVWRPSDGTWYILPSQGGAPIIQQWGMSEDVPVAGDFDGDGKSDYAIWRPSDGTWYILPSQGGAPIIQQWGMFGDVPISGDFDGDGKSDFVVWRPSESVWYMIPTRAGGPVIFQWGAQGDVPL